MTCHHCRRGFVIHGSKAIIGVPQFISRHGIRIMPVTLALVSVPSLVALRHSVSITSIYLPVSFNPTNSVRVTINGDGDSASNGPHNGSMISMNIDIMSRSDDKVMEIIHLSRGSDQKREVVVFNKMGNPVSGRYRLVGSPNFLSLL